MHRYPQKTEGETKENENLLLRRRRRKKRKGEERRYLEAFKITKTIIGPIIPNVSVVSWSLLPCSNAVFPSECVSEITSFNITSTRESEKFRLQIGHHLSKVVSETMTLWRENQCVKQSQQRE